MSGGGRPKCKPSRCVNFYPTTTPHSLTEAAVSQIRDQYPLATSEKSSVRASQAARRVAASPCRIPYALTSGAVRERWWGCFLRNSKNRRGLTQQFLEIFSVFIGGTSQEFAYAGAGMVLLLCVDPE